MKYPAWMMAVALTTAAYTAPPAVADIDPIREDDTPMTITPLRIPDGTACALFGLPLDQAPLKDLDPDAIADFLAEGGVNAVVHVPLKADLIAALRRRGIRCYGEIGCFVGDGHWKNHPESRPLQADGTPLEKVEWYAGVCASQEWLADSLVERVAKQCSSYDLDGVWLDFIRWPAKWEMREPKLLDTCYCANCLRRFRDETGQLLPEGAAAPEAAAWIRENAWDTWVSWRAGVIAGVTQRVKAAVVEHCGAGGVLGIFSVPLSEDEYPGALRGIVGQDLALLARSVDVFSPMSYHVLCDRPIPWIVEITEQARAASGKRIWPIIQAKGEPRAIGPDEYRKTLEAGLGGGASGVFPFTAADVIGTDLWDVQKAVYKSTIRDATPR